MVTKVSRGPPGHAAGLFAGSDGKGAQSQSLHQSSPSAVTGGDPLSAAMGQFGKGHSYLPGGMPAGGPAGADPTQHPGMSQIRDEGGGMRRNPRAGGIGETMAKPAGGPLGD